MSALSQFAETLIGSEIVKLGNEINTRIRQGEKIYNYTIGDFNPKIFPIPAGYEALIHQAYSEHFTNYPPADGIAELREAVVDFIKDREGISYETNEVLIASGGRPLIYTLFKTIVDPSDKVIYAVPSWNNNHYVHMTQANHCLVDASPENNFMPTVEDIKANIEGATLICLCTPQNPTGTTLKKEALASICDLILEENKKRSASEKKLYLMFDQMYWLLTYGSTEHFNPITLRPEMKDYTIIIDGVSKVFAATGVRVGWALGPVAVINKMKSLLSHIGAWAPMAEQKATAKYLYKKEEITDYLTHFKAELEYRLVNIYKDLIALKEKGLPVDAIEPQAALYLTIKFDFAGKSVNGKVLATQEDVTSYILSEAKLAVVPFYAFGAERTSSWYRLSVGTCDKNEIPQMLSQLENALKALK